MSIIGGDIVARITGGVFKIGTDSFAESSSPASVLAKYLIDQSGDFTDPPDAEDWPIYVGFLPDDEDIEFDCAAVYDTSPLVDTKRMDGTYVVHNGIQLRVRADSYETARAKIVAVVEALALLSNTEVEMSATVSYEIVNVSIASDAVFIGRDEKNRSHFTSNLLLKLKEL